MDYKGLYDRWTKLFQSATKSNLLTHDNIPKIATGQEDDYTTGCLLDYNYLNDCYKMMAIDLIKQQVLDADPKVIQQLNFTANLDQDGSTTMFFIVKGAKKIVSHISQGTAKIFYCNLFYFNILSI